MVEGKIKITFTIFIITCLVLISGCSVLIKPEQKDIPIFLYHSVKPELEKNDGDYMAVTSDKFEEDLKYLKDNGYTSIDMKTLIDYNNDPRTKLPKKPFVITFDDGYLNNYEYAYPLLKKYKTKAVIYTIVWSVGRDKHVLNDNPITPHFTWEQGKEMIDSGLIELGSHTFDMHNPIGLSYGYGQICGLGLESMENESKEEYYARIYADIEKSKTLMEENLGTKINTIAYPYGKYNDTILEVIKDLGIELGFIAEGEGPNKSIFEIKRIIVPNNKKISELLITN